MFIIGGRKCEKKKIFMTEEGTEETKENKERKKEMPRIKA
jgi:hypothetical protein